MRKNIQAIRDQEEVKLLEQGQEFKKGLSVISQSEVAKIDREHAIQQAEKYLDGREYDLNRITAEINAQLGVAALATVEVGRRLIAVKTVEGHGKFCTWVENNFPLSQSTANNWMRFSEVMQARPELNVLAKGGISKALVLLNLPEEYLQEIEEGQTIDGKPLDELQAMTKKELEAKIKKLKNEQEKNIAEETKTLKAENDALVRENKHLKKFEPVEEATPEWCIERAREIQTCALRIATIVKELLLDERLKDDVFTLSKMDVHIRLAEVAIRDLVEAGLDTSDED